MTFILTIFILAAAQQFQPFNVCYAIDESRSIDAQELALQTAALIDVTDSIHERAPDTAYSAVGFSRSQSTISSLTMDLDAFKAALRKKPEGERNVDTFSGLGLAACEDLLTGAKDPRIILFITNGQDSRGIPNSAHEIDVNVTTGINDNAIVTVGVGDGNSETEKQIASTPDLYTDVLNSMHSRMRLTKLSTNFVSQLRYAEADTYANAAWKLRRSPDIQLHGLQ